MPPQPLSTARLCPQGLPPASQDSVPPQPLEGQPCPGALTPHCPFPRPPPLPAASPSVCWHPLSQTHRPLPTASLVTVQSLRSLDGHLVNMICAASPLLHPPTHLAPGPTLTQTRPGSGPPALAMSPGLGDYWAPSPRPAPWDTSSATLTHRPGPSSLPAPSSIFFAGPSSSAAP